MLFRHLNQLKFIQYRYIHKQIYKMNQAYLRHLEDTEKFELTFQYVDPIVKINREFNFCRQISESVNSFVNRVATNIEKVIKKKTKNQNQNVEVTVTVNGNLVKDETTLCRDVFAELKNSVILSVCNTEFKVVINSPWISSVSLPSSILAGFPIHPNKFECIYTDRQLSDFNWLKSKDKNVWELVGEGFIYNTQNSDIGYYLKLSCLPKNNDFEGPTTEAISTTQVQAGPGYCPFETRHQFTKNKCGKDTFRVVSYNILADLYCDLDYTREVLHPYCPTYALAIDYRKQLFIKEITGYNADLICLQEVDRKMYTHDLQPIFEQLNYDSDYCIKRGTVAEGSACFFNKLKFKKLESLRLVLSDEINKNPTFVEFWLKIQENEKLKERILDRSTVLQVNILQSLDNNEILVVGNTHLYFHPDADHIRLLQGAITIKYLEQIVGDWKLKSQKRVSLIFCGDFNSTPDCGIYELYTTGKVSENHVDFQSKPDEVIRMNLEQNLCLKSACGTPKFTNFTAGFADCLDYIYCDSNSFEVIEVVPFPSLEELQQHTALPSVVFPSDHIALISDLKWT